SKRKRSPFLAKTPWVRSQLNSILGEGRAWASRNPTFWVCPLAREWAYRESLSAPLGFQSKYRVLPSEDQCGLEGLGPTKSSPFMMSLIFRGETLPCWAHRTLQLINKKTRLGINLPIVNVEWLLLGFIFSNIGDFGELCPI